MRTIKELQAITSGFKAETGQTGAGTISVVTKSGTNRFEGSAFAYFRPTRFVGDNPLTGARPAKQDRPQYGGVLGGPIVMQSWRFVTFFNNFAGTHTFAAGTAFPFNAANPATYPFRFTQTFGTSGLHFNDSMAALFALGDLEIKRGVWTRSSRATTTTWRRVWGLPGMSATRARP